MYIATPAYREPQEATKRTAEAIHARMGATWRILQNCPWVGNARTELAGQFLDSGESALLWLDADISFDVSVLETMRAADADVITATYQTRKPPNHFVMRTLHAEHPADATRRMVGRYRVIEIESDGLGCTLVKRHVIESLWNGRYGAPYLSEDGQQRFHIFAHDVAEVDGIRRIVGEDWMFFQRVKAAGFKVECLVDAEIVHDGIPGNLADVFGENDDEV